MKKQTRFIVVVSALLALSYAVSLTAQVGFADEPAVVTAPAQPVKEPTATNETGGDAAPKPKGILKKGGKKGKKGGVNWGDEKGGSLGQERSITVGQNKKELSLKIIENGIKDTIDQNDLTQLIESDPLAKLLEQEKEKIKDTFEKDIESARERLKEIKKEIGKGPKRKAPTTEEDGTFRDRLSQAYDNRTKLLQEQKKLQAEIAEKVKERDASIAKLEAEQPVRKEALNKLIEAQKKILKLKAEIIKANPQTVEDFAKLTDKINDAFENETENPDAKADIKQIVAQKAFKVVTQTDALTTDPNGVELIKTALEATTAGNIRQLVEATKALTDPVAQATAKSLIDQHLKDLTTKAADRIIEK